MSPVTRVMTSTKMENRWRSPAVGGERESNAEEGVGKKQTLESFIPCQFPGFRFHFRWGSEVKMK